MPDPQNDSIDVIAIKELLNKSLTLKKGTFYFLLLLSASITSIISTVSSMYLTEKISSYVVKEEFSESLQRLEKTVEITEEIQQEIKAHYSDSLESKKILRVKYEEIYLSTIELMSHLEAQTTAAINRKFPIVDDKPKQKIIMLQSLYFPKLEAEFFQLEETYLNYQLYLVELSKSKESRFQDPKLVKELSIEQEKVRKKVENYRRSLIRKYSVKLNL